MLGGMQVGGTTDTPNNFAGRTLQIVDLPTSTVTTVFIDEDNIVDNVTDTKLPAPTSPVEQQKWEDEKKWVDEALRSVGSAEELISPCADGSGSCDDADATAVLTRGSRVSVSAVGDAHGGGADDGTDFEGVLSYDFKRHSWVSSSTSSLTIAARRDFCLARFVSLPCPFRVSFVSFSCTRACRNPPHSPALALALALVLAVHPFSSPFSPLFMLRWRQYGIARLASTSLRRATNTMTYAL
jgi:hypothetical protein